MSQIIISFEDRTISQLYTAWSHLWDRYQCRIQFYKKLIRGLWTGYFVVNKEINSLKMSAVVNDHERAMGTMIRNHNSLNQYGIYERMKTVIRRHYDIPVKCITPKLISTQLKSTTLRKRINQNKMYEKSKN